MDNNPLQSANTGHGFARLAGILIWAALALPLTGTTGAESRRIDARPGSRPPDSIAREMLNIHNEVRAGLKLPPLQWSNQLASFSQKWANVLAGKNRPAHNPNSPYGENIFISGTRVTPSMVVKEWASESRDYIHGTNSCDGDCGHYTQIVWRNTRRVGCAVARSTKREIWVCSYDPPGNYRGEWPY